MICPSCQREIAEGSNYCYLCGARQGAPAPGVAGGAAPPRRLVRPTEGRVFGGVCLGFARYLEIDTTLLRLLWVFLVIFTGVLPGVVAYLIAWMVVPEGAAAPLAGQGTGRQLRRSVRDRQFAGVCGGLGEYLNVDSTFVRLLWVVLTIVPGAILGGIGVYLVWWLVVPETSAALPASAGAPSSPATLQS